MMSDAVRTCVPADTGPVVVRRTCAGEAERVSSVLEEAAEWLRLRGDPLWSLADLGPARVRADVDAGCYVLAFLGARAVGTARLTREDPLFWPDAAPGEALYLHRLAVRREQAGGGVSHAILDWVADAARALGRVYLRLDCDAARPRLRRLYEERGFMFHSERVVGAFTVVRLQKDLTVG
jgi:GNAT superfamily N-acetyltransferase